MEYWQLIELGQNPAQAAKHIKDLLECVASKDESVMNAASEALEHCDSPETDSVTLLTEFVQKGNDDQIYWACTLLGRMGDRANPLQRVLCDVLNSSHPASSVDEAAAKSLGQIGSLAHETKHVLQSRLPSAGPRLKRFIAQALGTLID